MRTFILISILLLSSLFAQAQDLEGHWQNELGSVLVIDSLDADGALYGSYRSSSGTDGRVFPLIGHWNKKSSDESYAISFTVHWKDYGSITAWSGYTDEDENGPIIKTLWHLVRPGAGEPWERIIANSSTFRRL